LHLPTAPKGERQKMRALTWKGVTRDTRMPARRRTGAAPGRRNGGRRGANPRVARGRLRRVPATARGTQPGWADTPALAGQPCKRLRTHSPTRWWCSWPWSLCWRCSRCPTALWSR
jgi:hypothetical protein